MDQQKLRVNDLFRRFDGNHDGMLTREEFMKALRASGESKKIISVLFIRNIESFSHERTITTQVLLLTKIRLGRPHVTVVRKPMVVCHLLFLLASYLYSKGHLGTNMFCP